MLEQAWNASLMEQVDRKPGHKEEQARRRLSVGRPDEAWQDQQAVEAQDHREELKGPRSEHLVEA